VLDIMARIVAQRLTEKLDQQVIVDNKPGAGGNVGADIVAKAAPDGYTMLMANTALVVSPYLYAKMTFDPLADLVPVTMVNSAPLMLVVHPSMPAKSVAEFVAYAKANPGKLNYGSGGNGTNTHLGGELFKREAGIDLVHVPYKGAGQVLQDLMGGQVQALVTSLPTALPHIKSGKLRALMVTSDKRSPLLPDVPSAKEAGLPKVVMDFWVGFSAPAGTPQPVVEKLNKAIADALTSPDGRKRLAEQGLEPVLNSPAQASQLVAAEMQRWDAVVKAAGIKAD
jgi:tripartite-type tricarboxylate transporter receptor subunit TctC